MIKKEIFCTCCGKLQISNNFYKSYSILYKKNTESRMSICKACILYVYADYLEKYNDKKMAVYEVCKKLDVYYSEALFDSANIQAEKNNNSVCKIYFQKANSLGQYKNLTFDDSGTTNSITVEQTVKKVDKNECEYLQQNDILSTLKDKFGLGYPNNEYALFEKKYQELRPSFQLLTTMHEECLREYCINKVKEGLAKSKGDFKEAKEWASMAKDVASSGKLNPNQMSKADLSGGLDTFGQMSRMVEETEIGELMRVLPVFMDKPKDKVDVTLWMYINYVRDLKGMEECEYKDIYDFYNKRVQEYEGQMIDGDLSGDINE